MEIREFQEKLKETLELAVKNGKKIHADTVEELFAGNGLTEGQIQKVYEYLAVQGIQVEGKKRQTADAFSEQGEIDLGGNEDSGEKEEKAALSQEELEYLKDYESMLSDIPKEKPGERESLYKRVLDHEDAAKKRLAELYMSQVVTTARELKHREVFIGDMIAEGNIGLLSAIEMLHEAQDIHTFLCGEIRNAILLMLEEQTDRKQGDDILVEKVRDLETRIKELLEDEEVKYSVDELAAFLDMDVDEIQAVLRLTGDDK